MIKERQNMSTLDESQAWQVERPREYKAWLSKVERHMEKCSGGECPGCAHLMAEKNRVKQGARA
jgi:hypothetical protein